MHRHLQQLLNTHQRKFSEAERVLQTRLDEPMAEAAPRTRLQTMVHAWTRGFARAFTALFIAQTLMAAGPAYAQLTAAPGAPSGQKPLIDAAANGVPIVLIAPPSQAGVSRNQYNQFNVDPRGLILNNSTGDVQTQQGGWIRGNLQLGLTPARIILNEVTGPNASQLRGTIEVGGQKADIVIANPNGITCDGCGFLNADRATLSTGTPQFGADGAITGFDVRQGVLSIGPGGLNATEQQQLDLHARGLVIEGEVWTQNLQALIGANQVVQGTLGTVAGGAAQDGAGEAPRFAIDIRALGGMYANSIFLIATDKGLGVNSTGRLATLAGNLVLSAQGDLTLKDSYSSRDMQLASTGKIVLAGQTLAEGTARIEAPQQLANAGALQASKLELVTPGIDNAGSIAQSAPGQNLALVLPAGLGNSGTIYTPGDLSVQASTVGASVISPAGTSTASLSGQMMAGGAMQVSADSLDLRGQQIAANGDITVQAGALRVTDGGMNAGGSLTLDASGKLDVTGSSLAANGTARLTGNEIALESARVAAAGNVQITSAGALAANAAAISSNASLTVQGRSVDLRSGTVTAAVSATIKADAGLTLDASQVLAGQQVSLQGQGISTLGATVAASQVAVDAGAGALNNQGGKILASSTAADALVISAAGINNQSGELRANGGLTLDAGGGQINNTDGVIAGTSGTLTRLGGLTNRRGTLYTQSDLTLSGTALDNAQGTIATAGNLVVSTPGQDIDNTAGVMQAGGTVALDAGNSALKTTGGTVSGGTSVTVAAGSLLADDAKLGSGGEMTLAVNGAASLNGATASAAGNLNVQAVEVQATGATAASAADMVVNAGSLRGGAWTAQGSLTATAQGALDVTGGGLAAGTHVTATGQGITTANAKVGGQTVTLNAGAGALDNTGGAIQATGNAGGVGGGASGQLLAITANGINNSGGVIASAADANINAGGQVVNNTGGTIQIVGALQMQAGQLLNRGGNLTTGSALSLQGFALDNHNGTIQTNGNLSLNTAGQALDNTGGKLVALGNATINAGTFSNAGGTVSAGGATAVQAASLDTTGGRISGTRQLDVLATQHLGANNATLATQGALTASAATVDAQSATLQAGNSLTVSATGALDLTGASATALGEQAGDIELSGGSVAARGVAVAGDAAVKLASGGALDAAQATVTAFKSLTAQAAGTLTLDGAALQTNEHLAAAGSSIAATAASLSAGGKLALSATAGAAALDNATLTAGDTAAVAGTGIGASNARIGAVGDVTLAAGSGDFTAPNALVQSQAGGITIGAAQVNLAASQAPVGGAVSGAVPVAGLVASQALAITASGAVDTSNAVIGAGTSVTIDAQGALYNRSGQILAGTQAALGGSSLVNDGGVVDANGPVNITVSQGTVSNDQGRITTRDWLTMGNAAGALTSLSNQGGTINSTGVLSLNQQDFNNAGGSVIALTGLTIAGGAVNNTGGTLAARGSVAVNTAGGAFQGDNGQILSGQGSVTLTAGATTLAHATVTSAHAVSLATTRLDASAARIDARDGFAATASAGGITASQAQITAGTYAMLNADQGVSLAGGSLSADTISIDARHGAVDNRGGTLAATSTAGPFPSVLVWSGSLANDGGQIRSNGAMSLNALGGAISNAGGAISAVTTASLISTGLDNRGGSIAANGDLTIRAAQADPLAATDNAGGAIRSAQGSVTMATGDLRNANAGLGASGAGTITAATDLAITAAGSIDNTGARIAADGNLAIAATGSMANAGGTLQAVGTARLDSNGLDNRRGTLVGNGTVSVNAAMANAGAATLNSGGVIASRQGGLSLTAGDLSNTGSSGAGVISAATDASVAARGAIDNTGAQIIAGRNLDLFAGGSLANTGGILLGTNGSLQLISGTLTNARNAPTDAGSVIAAGTDLSVTVTGDVDNARSEMSAGRDLTLTATGALANDAGRLVGARNASVSANSVGNTAGLIGANGNAAVRAGTGGLTNSQGAVQAGGDLLVQSQGSVANDNAQLQAGGKLDLTGTALTNAQGVISAQTGNVTLNVGSYANQGGTINAGDALTLDTHGGSLTANGATFSSQGAMTLAAGSGAAQFNDANLTSGAALAIAAGSLQATRANAQAAGNLNASATGNLDAAGSTWVAGQAASLTGGAITLTDSTAFGNTGVAISGTRVDASRASITSPGDVSVVASSGALNIGNATLMAGQDLTASGTGAGVTAGAQVQAGRDLTLGNGASFDFASPDLQYQFGRDLTVRAQGISTAGQNVSARNLTLDAGSGQLNNAGGTLQATGSVSASGTGLNNTGGTIAANGQVTAQAGGGTLNNASGQIYSVQGSTAIGGALIANASGTVSGAQDVALSGGTLDNTGNQIVAGRNLTASLSGAVNNAGGQLLANTGSASVTANGIDNTGGTISGAAGATADASSGTLANTAGLVNGANVSVGGAVQNTGGVISGSNSVAMTTRALNNDAGVIESGTGGITINTQGGALTNSNSGSTRGIVSQGAISISTGELNNQAGYIGANGSLGVASGSVNNQAGTLLGLGGLSLNAGNATVDNRGGAIKSGADLALTAGTLNNSGAASTVFAGRDLTVAASTIDNSGTKNAQYSSGLLAARNATVTAGTINNAGGAIVSLGDTTVRATASLNNASGQIAGNTVSIDAPQFTNTGGRADAQSYLSMHAPGFSADGVLASNGAMELSLQGDQVNTGTVSANGGLTYSTTGKITNLGQISALGALSLTGSGIDNAANAVIDAATSVTLNAGGGTLNNAGLINAAAGAATISAGTLNNTGRIYGDSVAASATVNNSMNAAGAGAVIASRSGDITVNGSLNNTAGGMVLSLNNMTLNGAVLNQGSILNAARDIRITGNLTNSNAGFATGTQTRSETGAAGLYITPSGSTTQYNAADLAYVGHSGGHWVLPSTTYPFATYGANPVPAAVQCGLDGIGGEGGNWVCGYTYTVYDPIWSLAGVPSPGAPPPDQAMSCTDFGGESGNTQRIYTGACGGYWASYDAYQTAMASAYARLDTAISAFNADLNSRTLIDWYETTITGKTIVETVVTASQPGQVLAGGNITLAGGVNSKSRIVAGGSVIGSITQDPALGTSQTTETGTMVFSHRVYHGGFSDSYSRDVSAPQDIANAPVVHAIELPINPPAGSLPAAGNSTPAGAALASVPGAIGASASSTHGTTGATATTGQTTNGTTTSQSGSAVTVQTQTAATAGTSDAPATLQTADTGAITGTGAGSTVTASGATTVATGQTSGAQTGADVTLAAAPEAPLRGSVIAAQVRAGQAQAIAALQTSFAEHAAILPAAPQSIAASATTRPADIKAAGYTTVTASGALRAPNSQLFRLNSAPGGRYLVETDPAFTSYRNWASSSYMLTQLAMDPERTLKLYGDGFAEQRLIDDQIMALTGRRYLSGYASTEEEYQALMDAGVMIAREYHLTPGVALSADQMAALTTDIVWLENKTITLPDGSTTQAVVPVVYLRRPVAGDLNVSGTLIAGSNVTLRTTGDLGTGGTVYAYGDKSQGDGKLTLEGANVTNTGTLAGSTIAIKADNTINNAGGVIQGLGQGSSATLNARDIILRTTTQTSSASIEGPNGTSTGTRTNADRIATVGADSVTLAALNNITLAGASVKASNDLGMTAGGTITSDAVQTGYTLSVPMGGNTQGRSSYYEVQATSNQLSTLSGTNVSITALGDANFKGTSVSATNNLSATAKNITIDAVKNSLSIDQQGVNRNGYERVAKADESLAGGAFTAGNNVSLIANGDKTQGQGNITTTGAIIAAGTGQASLIASNDVKILNATTEHSQLAESYDRNKSLFTRQSKQQAESTQTTQVNASSIVGSTVLVQAGNDVTIRASGLNAVNDAQVNAGRDIHLVTAEQTSNASSFYEEKKSGLSINIGQLSLGKASQDQTQTSQTATQVGSAVSAANVRMTAGRDATITASNVLADNDISVSAGRNINILAANNTQETQGQAHSSSTTIGLAPLGVTGRFTLFGQTSASQDGNGTVNNQSTSLLSANNGNLTLTAGTDSQYRGTGQGNVTSQGADLIAKGAVAVTGNAVDLQAAQDNSTSASHAESKSLTIGSQLTGVIGGAITHIGDMVQEASDTSNSRLQGALLLKSGYDAYKLVQGTNASIEATQAADALGASGTGIGVSVSISASKSSQDATQASATQRGTNVQAQTIAITARDTDINAAGAKLQAQDISLDAAKNINLGAAVNTVQSQSTNTGSSAGIGATLSFGGAQNGLSFQANASKTQGNANGSETTYDNTLVSATNKLTIKSGADTNLIGAQVAGGTVKADIGGNLNIQTLQDQSNYESKQTSSGFAISVCVPPLCGGAPVTGSISSGKQTIDHNYQSATGQSGIAAGAGGFDINVAGNTDLKGGALTSEADKGKNSLHTASLTYSDLTNTQNTSASNSSLSLGYSGLGGAGAVLGSNVVSNVMGNLQGGTGLPGSGSQSGATLSVISPANVTITGKDVTSQDNAAALTSRDAATANGSLKNTLTLQQAQDLANQLKQQQEAQRVADLVGSVVTNVIGDVAANAGWADGSAQKLVLHGVAGVIQAKLAGGSAGAGLAAGVAQEALAPVLSAYLEANGISRLDAKGNANPDYTALMQAGATLAGAAVGAIVGGNTAGAAIGASVGLTGVTNNFLKHVEIEKLVGAQAGCSAGDTAACAERDSLQALSASRDAALSACSGQDTSYCSGLRQEVRVATAEIIRAATTNPDIVRTLEEARTIGMANGTLSIRDRVGGIATGFVQATVEGISNLAQGIATFARAAIGNESSRDQLGQTVESLVRLSNPATLAQVISAATSAQREQLALAYEAGDAFAIGLVGGNVLASLPMMPVGSIKSVGTAVKTADQVVVEAATAGRVGASGVARGAAEVLPSSPLVIGGGLQVYEDVGGHLIARHVGLSQAALAERLATSSILTASTFTSRAVAEAAVSATLSANATALNAYIRGNSAGYLALEFSSNTVVGSSLARGSAILAPVSNVRVVVARDAAMPTGFRIITGYPY